MKSSFPLLKLLGTARDCLAGILAASGATRVFRWRLTDHHRPGSLILPALLLSTAVLSQSDVGAAVELRPQDTLDSLPTANVSTNTLRGAILQAHNFPSTTDVIIKLKTNGIYRIRRPTVFNGQTTEGAATDPYHGDFDLRRNLIIDGQGAVIDAQHLGRIFDFRAPVRVTIRNVTLRGGGDGDTAGAGRLDGGGAVRISNSASVAFENVVFENNRLDGLGYTGFERRGGAIYVADTSGSSVYLTDCHFEWNGVRSAGSGQGAAGGAIYQVRGLLYVVRTRFVRCWAMQDPGGDSTSRTARGGAIYADSGDVTITASEFVENSARGADGNFWLQGQPAEGGAIYAGSSVIGFSVKDTRFRRNSAKAGRGADNQDQSAAGGVTLQGARASGGAVFLRRANFSTTFQRCEFEENFAFAQSGGYNPLRAGGGGEARGGAISIEGGPLNLVDTRFVVNFAVGGDGGFTARTSGGFWGNQPRGGSGGAARGGAVYAGSNHGVYVSGALKIEVSGTETNVTATALFAGNRALGGYGRPGRGNQAADGAGGEGSGGGIWLAGGPLELKNVLAHNNSSQGGGGANVVGQPRFNQNDGSDSDLVGRGGSNGDGLGGFAYGGGGTTLIEGSKLAFNRATGGRFEARVILKVPPENNAAWSVSKPDPVAPFVAGSGGSGENGLDGAPGGEGGEGMGGAVFSRGRVTVRGSGVMANQAYGARGGPGWGAADVAAGTAAMGGTGGAGGIARGGGIVVTSTGAFDIQESFLVGNITIAGTGGSGGKGGKHTDPEVDSDCESGCGGAGGAAGAGGDALGGGLYSERFSTDPTKDGRLVASFVAENKVIAGDGFFGGHGGTGGGFRGGAGGQAGRGGTASGGGIYASVLHAERVTVDRNIVSSGWGGAGGHGGAGDVLGGLGSSGGNGGFASGGGVYISGSSQTGHGARLVLCTVSNNKLFAGRGGQGGFGGPAWVAPGNGANGGASGLAQGGGLSAATGGTPIQLTDTSVARNIIDAGDGGFAGIGAPPMNSLGSRPVRYQAAEPGYIITSEGWYVKGPPIVDGASSVIRDEQGFPVGMAPREQGYVAPITFDGTFPLHEVSGPASLTETEKWIVNGVNVGVGAVGTGLAGSAVGVAAALPLFVGGSVTFGGTVATTAATGGAFLFLPVAGIGLSAVTVSMVAATWVGYMIATDGDFEASATAMLGQPGDVSRYNLFNLITAPGEEIDDDEYEAALPGRDGSGGQYRTPEGSGVYGNLSLSGTLVGDNSAWRRRRPYQQKNISGVSVREFIEEKSQHGGEIADVAGGVTSKGGNFITIAPSGFATSTYDIFGTAANPKVALVASEVANYGGDVPTLKLLPGSPARGAIPASFGSSQSQNGFSWLGTRDIGAWGAPPNRRPSVRDHVIRVARGSGKVSFSRRQLLEANPDPDGDELSFTNDYFIATAGEAATFYPELNNDEVRIYSYTPPADFVGIMEVFQFALSDGQFVSNVGKVIVHVVPGESDLECPPFGSGRTILIASEPVGGSVVTTRHIELPVSTRSDHNFTGPFTVEFWMRKDRDWAHQHEPLITKGDGAWRIQRGSNTDKLAFAVTGLDPLSLYSNREIKDRNWHHVAAVYDGKHKLIYIDGELDSWAAVTGTPAVNNQPVWIGGNSQFTQRRFRGHMDEVRIWNNARSSVEIRENFIRSLTGYEPGLLTYYTFDEPNGSAVLNFAMQGTSEPGFALAYQTGQAVWRPEFSINRSQIPINWTFGTRIVGSHLFYNQSAFDGFNPAATAADDNAIAPNIWPLLPGEVASEANRSSYSRGINGVIIDIASPLDPNALSLADFEFAFGNDNNPDSWKSAEPPASILIRPGAGECSSTRVALAWADYQAARSVPNRAVGNGWLRVTVRANERTGLHHDGVFHFGSSIGDSDDADLFVTATDGILAMRNTTTNAAILNPYDYTRDGTVTMQDAQIALRNSWMSFHLLDLRVAPYRGTGDAAVRPALRSLSAQTETDTVPLHIHRGFDGRFQLTIPAIAAKGGDISGLILTAPTPTGPWSILPGGLVTNLGNQELTIELVPDQQAAFYRLETDSAAR